MRHIKCDNCGTEFESAWTEEEAVAELKENYEGIAKEECAVVCDDCYEKIRKQICG